MYIHACIYVFIMANMQVTVCMYQRSFVKCVIKWAKKEYFHEVFGEIKDDYKEVFRIAKKLLFNDKQSPFPEAPDDKILGDLFNDLFIRKIEKICLELGVLFKSTWIRRIILSNKQSIW